MRRAIGVLAAAALGASSALSAQQVTARVGGEPTATTFYQTIHVPITVDMTAAGGQMLGSYTARLTWNPNVLYPNFYTCCGQVDSTTLGNFPAAAFNTDSAYSYGILKFTAVSPSGVGGLVTVAQLRFTNYDTIPTPIQLSFSEMSAAGTFANLLPSLTVQNATFCSARGRWGDLDRDGQSNSRDALFVLSQVVGLAVNPLVADTSLADVDADGRNTSRDALVILSYAVGIPIPGQRVLLPAANSCGTGSARQLAVSPSAIDLAVGQEFRLVAQATDSAGRVVSTPLPTWRSSDNTVAAVGTDGTVSPRGPGTATVTAEVSPGVTATATVTVIARRPNWIVDIAATGRPVQNGSATYPYEHPLQAFPWVAEGDTIRVTTGSYYWDTDGDLGAGIVLLGGTPGDTTTRPVFRDPQNSYTALRLNGGRRAVIRNVVFHNFSEALDLNGVLGLAVEDTKFLYTGSASGDAIYHCGADMDTVRIDRSAFIGDPQYRYADAVYVSGCSQLAVRVMLFRDSRIQYMSDALYMYGVDSLQVLRSRITDNTGYGVSMSQEYNETPALYMAHSRVERNRYYEVRADDMRRVVIDTSVIRADSGDALYLGGDFSNRARIYLHGDSIYHQADYQSWLSVFDSDSLVIEDLVLRAPDDTSRVVTSNINADVAIVRRSRFLNLGGSGYTVFSFNGRRLLADSVTMTGCAVGGCDQAYGFDVTAAGTQPSAQILRSSFTQLAQPIQASGAGMVLDVRNVTADSLDYGVDASFVDSVTIRDNVFTRVRRTGLNLVYRVGSRGPSLVAGNSISCTASATQQGVYLYDFAAVMASDTVTACLTGVETNQARSGTRIRQSTLRNNGTGVYVSQFLDTTLIRIDSTGISGSTDGVYVAYGTVSLTHNRIEANTDGLEVSSSQGVVTQVHDNAFVNNTGFAVIAGGDSVDASANWWGAAAAPGGTPPNGVSGRVNTTGFLTSAPPNLPGLAPPVRQPTAAAGTRALAPTAATGPAGRPRVSRDPEAAARERAARREAERRARDEHRAAHEARRQRTRQP